MRYLVRRLGFFLVTVWAAVTINFLIPRLMPGNPAAVMLAKYPRLNPAALKALEIDFGIKTHQSWIAAYFDYWHNTLTLNFGVSSSEFPESVGHAVMQALPWTLMLVGVTTVLAFVLGTLIGLFSAWFRGGKLDSALPPIFVIASAFPYYWIALIFVLLFGLKLQWFPSSGGFFKWDSPGWNATFIQDAFEHSVLPALTILLTSIGGWILTMRNNMISVLSEDYVRMARAKGLRPWTVMWNYAGRNAILPNLTGFAMSLGFVVSGAILVEYVFNYPGLGYMLLNATTEDDFALMQALFLLITVAVLVAILASDFVTAFLDPRTRDAA